MPTANWKRLGELLVRRRIELDPRYRNRTLFADERGINYRTVSDIETGRRDNYEDGTIAAVEAAYRVTPGSLAVALEGGDLEPLAEAPRPDVMRIAEPSRPPSLAAQAAFPDDVYKQRLFDLPAATPEQDELKAMMFKALDEARRDLRQQQRGSGGGASPARGDETA